jgi:predicted nucleotidyltransferase
VIDELERLERAATPGPWGEFAESGDWWVEQRGDDGGPACNPNGSPTGFVCESNTDERGQWAKQEDIDLMIAARNALPALLRVARAARELEEILATVAADADAADVLVMRRHAARAELRAALAALEGAPDA